MNGNTDSVIWYDDVVGFFGDASVTHFYPSRNESQVQQLNAIMRLTLYFTVFVLIIRRDPNVLFVPIVVGAFTYVVNESRQNEAAEKDKRLEKLDLKEANDGQVCVRPTRDNPFMNVTFGDRKRFPNRPKACNPTHAGTRKQVANEFEHDLYKDVDDVFGRKVSSRQFYTMPATTIPNDQQAFAEWLYKTPKTCKEGNGLQCSMNMMERR